VTYRVQLSSPAGKQLDRFDKVTARRLRDRLKELSLEPFSPRISKPVKMEPGRRTSRVGNWRIIYRVIESDHEIRVDAFLPRDKAYP
jgi:mRNA interferase RelE/StbE